MPTNAELGVIPVTKAQARQYVDAIEGLIFDPQPYKPEGLVPVSETTKSFLRIAGFGQKRVDALPSRDPVHDNLEARYDSLVADRYYQLTAGQGEREIPEEERAGVYGSPLQVINERPSLLVDGGSGRNYQVDLRLVRDERTAIVFSFLHLQQKDTPPRLTEASLFMSSPGMFRLERDGEAPSGLYIPAFAEQQRLLAVNDLLRKHMKPTRTW